MSRSERPSSTITLSDPSGACRFETVRLTDAQVAEILGISLEELRAINERPGIRGTVTCTGIDHAAGTLTVDPESTAPFQGPVGALRRRKVVR